MLRFLLYALLIWFAYNFIFRFVVPVYRASRQFKQKFREMHENMQEQVKKQAGFAQPQPQQTSPNKHSGDYIDFEEIK